MLLCGILWSTVALGQENKNLERGVKYFDLNMFEESLPYLEKEKDNKDRDVSYLAMQYLAKAYSSLGRFEDAEKIYMRLSKWKKKDPSVVLSYALALKASSKYDEAIEQFKAYVELKPDDPMGELYIQSCYLAQQWLDESLGTSVRSFTEFNSTAPDFSPAWIGTGFVFSSQREGSKKQLITFNASAEDATLDLYLVDIEHADQFGLQAYPLLNGINTPLHEGPCTFDSSLTEIYFTRTIKGEKAKKIKRSKEEAHTAVIPKKTAASKKKSSYSSKKKKKKTKEPLLSNNVVVSTLNLFYAKRDSIGGKWSKASENFEFNSKKYSVGHPSLSADGKLLFFMSDMPGGYGSTDIWYVVRQADGSWGKPINAGPQVNTFGNELFPYIHPNGTLYFSSNVHPGMGKLDIFSATPKDSIYINVTNMKPPINSLADDFGITFDNSGKNGLFSSDRFNGMGFDDIYAFTSSPALEITLDGPIWMIPEYAFFDGVEYTLKNDDTKSDVEMIKEKGTLRFILEPENNYTLTARKEGFPINKVGISYQAETEDAFLKATIKPTTQPVYFKGVVREPEDSVSLYHPEAQHPMIGITVEHHEDNVLSASAISNKKGAYRFDAELNPGIEHLILVSKKPPIEINEILVITGIITGEDKPLDKALVLLTYEGEIEMQLKTDNKGFFLFEVEAGKSYTIIAQANGFENNSKIVSTVDKNDGEILQANIELSPKPKVELSGIVTDGADVIDNAAITIYDGGNVVEKQKTNEEGEFTAQVQHDKDYNLTATKKGYFQAETIVTAEQIRNKETFYLPVKLEPIVAEKTIVIDHIYYDYNKADIRYESLPALAKLIEFLRVNNNVKIELSSHTDSRGGNDYNQILSEARANSVKMYLYLEGIDPNRIITKGYGETKLLNECADGVECSEEQHQLNRRTEFKIITL